MRMMKKCKLPTLGSSQSIRYFGAWQERIKLFGPKEEVRKNFTRNRVGYSLRLFGEVTWAKCAHLLDIFDEPSDDSSDAVSDNSNDEGKADYDAQITREQDEGTRECITEV